MSHQYGAIALTHQKQEWFLRNKYAEYSEDETIAISHSRENTLPSTSVCKKQGVGKSDGVSVRNLQELQCDDDSTTTCHSLDLLSCIQPAPSRNHTESSAKNQTAEIASPKESICPKVFSPASQTLNTLDSLNNLTHDDLFIKKSYQKPQEQKQTSQVLKDMKDTTKTIVAASTLLSLSNGKQQNSTSANRHTRRVNFSQDTCNEVRRSIDCHKALSQQPTLISRSTQDSASSALPTTSQVSRPFSSPSFLSAKNNPGKSGSRVLDWTTRNKKEPSKTPRDNTAASRLDSQTPSNNSQENPSNLAIQSKHLSIVANITANLSVNCLLCEGSEQKDIKHHSMCSKNPHFDSYILELTLSGALRGCASCRNHLRYDSSKSRSHARDCRRHRDYDTYSKEAQIKLQLDTLKKMETSNISSPSLKPQAKKKKRSSIRLCARKRQRQNITTTHEAELPTSFSSFTICETVKQTALEKGLAIGCGQCKQIHVHGKLSATMFHTFSCPNRIDEVEQGVRFNCLRCTKEKRLGLESSPSTLKRQVSNMKHCLTCPNKLVARKKQKNLFETTCIKVVKDKQIEKGKLLQNDKSTKNFINNFSRIDSLTSVSMKSSPDIVKTRRNNCELIKSQAKSILPIPRNLTTAGVMEGVNDAAADTASSIFNPGLLNKSQNEAILTKSDGIPRRNGSSSSLNYQETQSIRRQYSRETPGEYFRSPQFNCRASICHPLFDAPTPGDTISRLNEDKPMWIPCGNPWGGETNQEWDNVLIFNQDLESYETPLVGLRPLRFTCDPFSLSSSYRLTHVAGESAYTVLILKRDALAVRPWGFSTCLHEFGGACLVTSVVPGSPAEEAVDIGYFSETTKRIGMTSALLVNDMIVCVNGRTVGGMSEIEFTTEVRVSGNSLNLVVARCKSRSLASKSVSILEVREKEIWTLDDPLHWNVLGKSKSKAHQGHMVSSTNTNVHWDDGLLSPPAAIAGTKEPRMEIHDNSYKLRQEVFGESDKPTPKDSNYLQNHHNTTPNLRPQVCLEIQESEVHNTELDSISQEHTQVEEVNESVSNVLGYNDIAPSKSTIGSNNSPETSIVSSPVNNLTNGSRLEAYVEGTRGFHEQVIGEESELLHSIDLDLIAGDEPWMGCVCGETHPEPIVVFWIQCDFCRAWYNVSEKCVGFDEIRAKTVKEWTCQSCKILDKRNSSSKSSESYKSNSTSLLPLRLSESENQKSQTGSSQSHVDRSHSKIIDTREHTEHLDSQTVRTPDQKDSVFDDFKVGDWVSVEARTWPGINKLGGVGKVERIYYDEDGDKVYDVSYILGGREKGILEEFVHLHVSDSPSSVGARKRQTKEIISP